MSDRQMSWVQSPPGASLFFRTKFVLKKFESHLPRNV
jgi:hypothetical protein